MLIEDMGRQLSHKPFERASWWWAIKWGSFIEIYPQLTPNDPLWQREESHLEDIRLCGLPPHALQEEIAAYWEKPFWKRWFLSFFTDIDNKIVIWSYYKRCLSFRIIHKENPILERRLTLYDPKQRLVSLLLNQLKEDHVKLENRLERYSGNAKWVEKNLNFLLVKNEIKRHRFFLRLVDQYLPTLSAEYDQDFVREKLEEEYQVLERTLRAYVQHSCRPVVPRPLEENPNRDVVVVGPVVATPPKLGFYGENHDVVEVISMDSIHEWLTRQRQTLTDGLKEEFQSYETIQSVLKNSLESLKILIEPQLAGYECIITDIIDKRISYTVALEWSECLQSRLNYFFRQSGLLFHPDKSDGDENLRRIKTELFKDFRKIVEQSLERETKGLKRLKRCILQREAGLDQRLETAEREERALREWFNKRFLIIEAQHAEIEAQHAEIEAQHAEIEAQHAEIEAQHAEIEAQQANIKAQHAEIEAQLTAFMKKMQRVADDADPEAAGEAACSSRFFRPARYPPLENQNEPEYTPILP